MTNLTPEHMIILLITLGWITYWLKQIDVVKSANLEKSIGEIFGIFFMQNWLEIPISAIAVVLVILSGQAPEPTDTLDYATVFMLGFGSSSFLNGLITKGRNLAAPPSKP